ncbi:PH domain-containing protein [Microbacterium sp. YY-01]|uniref:PH domain-containing protein n=1 Tax=Microbacterium sp. YY-01 TaxID=3421634 RepID=UPI003D180BA1
MGAAVGRPLTPPPGVSEQERLIARLRRHARSLAWSALALIAASGIVAYFYDNLPAPWENWMLLTAAAAVVVITVLVPFLRWRTRHWAITTRRVIETRGIFVRRRRELSHVRGYTITVRRGLLQRLWRAGTITLSDGVDQPIVLQNIPHVALVHETLTDQIEVNQILAHRDAQAATFTSHDE